MFDEAQDDSASDVEKRSSECLTLESGRRPAVMAAKKYSPLVKGLDARHMTMIAIGGTVSTGLIIGTGKTLAQSGPGSLLIAFILIAMNVFQVMTALAEMLVWTPDGSGFSGCASRYCDPSLGFALGWTYWFKFVIITPHQLTGVVLIIEYWCPAYKVNSGVWVAVCFVVIVTINYFGVAWFGEIEFWFGSIKMTMIISLIILCFTLVLGGGPTHDRIGFRYWDDPGAFKPYVADGAWGRFLSIWGCMVNAVSAFLGTEVIGVAAAEARNPRQSIPRAVRQTFFRITFLYLMAVLLLGMLVPWNSVKLAFANKGEENAAASPFVVAIHQTQIRILPGIVNACILMVVFSAANSDLYAASRQLYILASQGSAPSFLARTNRRGTPVVALAVSGSFCALALVCIKAETSDVFIFLINAVTQFGLLSWDAILISHIYFIRAREVQAVEPMDLGLYRAPFGKWGSYVALMLTILVQLTKSFAAFVARPFDVWTFVTAYIGIPIFCIIYVGHKVARKTKIVQPKQADLATGKEKADREAQEFLAEKEAQKWDQNRRRGRLFYEKYVSWLF